jgi:hypothetical protein
MQANCAICDGSTVEHARALVRNKHPARFFRCTVCGFMGVESPTWLAEAYAEPVNQSDTGYVYRNLWARDKMLACIESHLNPDGVFLDYAGGYGLLVRLMRDLGYDFRWADLYCPNIFCRGFEAPIPLVGPFEAVSVFEAFEHFTNPVGEMKLFSVITDCLVISTKLLPEPVPQPSDWWYYGLEHGQHIAFYTPKSLELLASRFGYHFLTNGDDLHVFSRKQIAPGLFDERQPSRWHFWDKPKPPRQSLTQPDHDFIVKTLVSIGK